MRPLIKRNTIPDSLLWGSSHLYGIGTSVRNFGYCRGALPVHKVPGLQLISVGNLRVGGTGKTPFALWLAERLQRSGLNTALLSRGYKGSLERVGAMVSAGHGPLCTPLESGDEAFMASHRLQGVSIWIGADRVASARKARDAGAEVAVLDDGFQHRRLHRDVDILLVTPEDLDPRTPLLPRGPLRERARAVERAHLIGGYEGDWRDQPGKPDFLLRYVPQSLLGRDLSLPPPRRGALPKGKAQKAYLLAGVARPERFLATCLRLEWSIVGASYFPDHHAYTKSELERVVCRAKAAGAELIVTTEKDFVRLGLGSSSIPIYALRIEAQVVSPHDILAKILTTLKRAASS